ncbi:aminoacyl-tRNA hydrolase [Mesorhizobium sp. SP-1A]|uniref:aminoacyl-tRNA hydrolase n=1 Tax=Mesorhizobium sp. SP-1A TaxID=3077840 RepID=UPI0028F6C1BB|nr:aminoacyl-tRNA hydrolase [Mesorhizobium sp. SP-1A]
MSDIQQNNLESALSGDVKDHRASGDQPQNELKMWLLLRKDLPMTEGKLAVQSGHAFGTCMVNVAFKNPELMKAYLADAQPKISVRVKNQNELETCIELCRQAGIEATTITDAGRTEFNEPTMTLGAIGPCYRDDLPKRVKKLQLFTGWSTENDA